MTGKDLTEVGRQKLERAVGNILLQANGVDTIAHAVDGMEPGIGVTGTLRILASATTDLTEMVEHLRDELRALTGGQEG